MFKHLLTPEGLKAMTPIIGFVFAALIGYAYFVENQNDRKDFVRVVDANTAAMVRQEASNAALVKSVDQFNSIIRQVNPKGSFIKQIQNEIALNVSRQVLATSTQK